jgi:serine/threonine protein kinase
LALTPGTRLGPYEIVSALGAGGMGEVYKARDTRLDRSVAIKIVSDTLATDRQFRERFDREARAISQLTIRTSAPSTTSAESTARRFWSWNTSKARRWPTG